MQPATLLVLLASVRLQLVTSSSSAAAFVSRNRNVPTFRTRTVTTDMSESNDAAAVVAAAAPHHPFCDLPGDPSLFITTNVDLGEEKGNIMKKCSECVASVTGKPESYVAVCITDNASMIFGGSDAPLALGCLYSIGGINVSNNGAIQSAVTDLLEPYGVDEARIYITFFDMERENVGWSRRTFGG